jgi:hypothetical protein
LTAQPGQFGAQVSQQQVGDVVGESVANHDAQYGQVGAVFGESIGRNQPAVFTQRSGDVEDGVAADLLVQGEGEDGQLIAAGQ